MAELAVTEALEKRVRARRNHPFAKPSRAPSLDKVWAHLHLQYKAVRNWWQNGFDSALGDPTLNDLAKRADAILKHKALQQFEDEEVAAAAERILSKHNYQKITIIEVIAHQLGPVAALRIKLRSTAFDAEHVRDANRWFWQLVPKPYDPNPDPGWEALREILCRADDATYAEAKALAKAERESAPLAVRVCLSFLFPSEPAWANGDAKEITPADPLFNRACVLASVTDADQALRVIELLKDSWFAIPYACDLAVGLAPDDAAKVLSRQLELAKAIDLANNLWVDLAVAVSSIASPNIARAFADMLTHKHAGPAAVDYLKRFPDLAKQVLGDVASGKSKLADAARSILAIHERSSASSGALRATEAELPPLLSDPPWLKKKKKAKDKPLALDPIELPDVIEWKPGEREAVKSAKLAWAENAQTMTEEDLKEYGHQKTEYRPVDFWNRWKGGTMTAFEVPESYGLPLWNEVATTHAARGPLYMLARYGERAQKGLFLRDPFAWTWDDLLDAQLHVVGRTSVALAVLAFTRRKVWRKKALAWLDAHLEVATLVLLPALLGPKSKEQREAETILRVLVQKGKGDAIVSAAARYGDEAKAAAQAFVLRDPLGELDIKGKMPEFVRVAELPPPRIKSGAWIPEAAVQHVVDILKSSPVDPPYEGIAVLKEALDPASLGELAWALASTWQLSGGKGAYAWMPLSLVHFGDDDCARKLAPFVREWGRKDAKKAELAVQILSAMGTDTALMHLTNLADKSRFEAVKTAAKEALSEVAASRGLTLDELGDRTVPDLELDADGTATLDFGPRSFKVSFDETLAPIVILPDGARAKTLPRANKNDEADKAKAASTRFKAIKEDAQAIAAAQVRRFEQAMIRGRVFLQNDFETIVSKHPLLVHLVRRVVWAVLDDDGRSPKTTFRVVEDGTYADATDNACAIDGRLGIVHPFFFDEETKHRWSQVFSDYELIQPFEQLGRAIYRIEKDDSALERFKDIVVRGPVLLGSLDSKGWTRWADIHVDGYSRAVRKVGGGDARVNITFSPGIDLGDVSNSGEQTLGAMQLGSAKSLGDIDPVDVSEVMRDLESFRR